MVLVMGHEKIMEDVYDPRIEIGYVIVTKIEECLWVAYLVSLQMYASGMMKMKIFDQMKSSEENEVFTMPRKNLPKPSSP